MYCFFWTLLGVSSFLLTPSSSQPNPLCLSAMERLDNIPSFCSQLQYRFNSTNYRINFTESEVDSVCNNDTCRDVMTDLVSSCFTFPKKDINCLDSPGLIRVWCSNSNVNDNTRCFTSLNNQGVIDTPNLFTPCLDAMYNAESCPDYCRNIFMNADCCFVSYYAFMLDAFVGSGGFPVFESMNFVRDRFWGWCGVTSPGLCPGLNLTDYSPRDNSVTCDFQPIDISTVSIPSPTPTVTPTPSDSPGGAIVQQPLIVFNILILLIRLAIVL